MSLADVRDLIVIVYGFLGALLFLVLIAVSVAAFFVLRSLSRAVKAVVEDPIRPTLEEVRHTATNARSASEFYADHAVHPLIKVVAGVQGIRRGIDRVTKLAKRGEK